jgi:putative ABC transport system substrate-binding protein
MFAFSLGPKRFELLHEVVPNAKLIAVLSNPSQPDPASKTDTSEVASAARAVGQDVSILTSSESDFESAFAEMVRQRAGGLIVRNDPYFNNRREQPVEPPRTALSPRFMNGVRLRSPAG